MSDTALHELDFDEATHIYTYKGKRVENVTSILDKASLSKYWNKDDWYMERGCMVHKATELYDRGVLDWESLSPDIIGFVRAYVRFRQDNNFLFELIEKRLYHPIYDYCGTLDRAFPLIDIKCGQENEYQLGAYWELLLANGYNPKREAYSLLLREDSYYKFEPVKDIKNLSHVFLCALTVQRHQRLIHG